MLIQKEKLEDDLRKQRQFSSQLQMKLDGSAAEYCNELQKRTDAKDELVKENKTLRQEKKGNNS